MKDEYAIYERHCRHIKVAVYAALNMTSGWTLKKSFFSDGNVVIVFQNDHQPEKGFTVSRHVFNDLNSDYLTWHIANYLRRENVTLSADSWLRLYCRLCRKANDWEHYKRRWFDPPVEALYVTKGGYVKLRCNGCGHTWYSLSTTARFMVGEYPI